MNQRPDKYIVAHKVSAEVGEKELCRQIDAYGQEGVILGDLHSELRNRLLKYCYAKEIRVYLTPKLSDIMVRKAEALHIFDTPLLLARNSGLSFDQRFCKRLLDLLVSTILLVITSPIMLIAALCIKLYDHGPATRIDELPQLLNIFKGDMSVVGPRPERPEIAKEYEESIPEFAYRLKVKAGLTGYAQIYGKYNTTAYDKLKLDLMYIESYSILEDLKLILATFKIVFTKESIEGLEEGQTISLNAKKEEKKDV